MASLAEIARAKTTLDSAAISHLQRLVSSWSLLSDLSFSDLLLYVPGNGASGISDESEFVVLGHTRSVTGATVHYGDPVGQTVSVVDHPLLARAMEERKRLQGLITRSDFHGPDHDDQLVEEDIRLPGAGAQIAVEYIPVRGNGDILAVLTREAESAFVRHRSPVERPYRAVGERLAQMVVDGAFPFVESERVGELREPRVGDGVVVLDREGRIEYASPNAVSAMHRLRVLSNLEGRRLRELGIDESAMRRAFSSRHSTVDEFEEAEDACVVVRCHPLIENGRVTGAVSLLRDISELRSRDRLLISKNTTIREIHHRVKNNLQTIQSLLRLQTRRLSSPEAIAAVEQSARRIGSIAVVHETLTADAGDIVDFDAVVSRLVRMVEEGLGAPERPLKIEVSGSIGALGGDVSMPLAVVVTELLQNSIDHGSGSDHPVTVRLGGDSKELSICVQDHGPGVPDGFSLDRDAGLGLTIVRTFVVSDLGGRITFARSDTNGGGSDAEGSVGTIVDVRVPRPGPALPLG
ncbi:MAG: PAS domain-containing protein [Acidimicrobiaceae bacterium]|nr:PAS domain-containing protein [Acidimicrobiaceae bacterium]MXW75854.1 PAS domain-containing protein [Acidimicrobiaceae bacterium]MYC43173.1 PAS domain-containing protein [Acidimicrobiaceae bacterium]MYD08183.1 PAS domain-containing protein [Acidimicrobiaceae bacterium]MYH89052.1 PAS domain-containing protein [Acidimicrobiaceae bacterium]